MEITQRVKSYILQHVKGCIALIKGCVMLFVGLSVLGLLLKLTELTWPICLPAGIAIAGWIFTTNSKNPFKSATHALLGPVAITLIILAVILLILNISAPVPNTET